MLALEARLCSDFHAAPADVCSDDGCRLRSATACRQVHVNVEQWLRLEADRVSDQHSRAGKRPRLTCASVRSTGDWKCDMLNGGAIKGVRLPSGEQVPALGQGTTRMGRAGCRRADCIAALRLGLDLGMTLIDTAGRYGDGEVEELVGKAIAGRREEVFLVSKVYPPDTRLVELRRSVKSWVSASLRPLVPAPVRAPVQSALQADQSSRATGSICRKARTQQNIVAACERSLRRLRADRLDFYLLHWRGTTPLAEALAAFQDLVQAGKIRYFGVSNFNTNDLEEWWSLDGGGHTTTDQVLYNLNQRAVERDVLPWCRHRGAPVMAYSPLDRGRILTHRTLQQIGCRHGVSPAQVALAWLLRQGGLIAIPEATRLDHVRANRAALGIHLTSQDLAELDDTFPDDKQVLA